MHGFGSRTVGKRRPSRTVAHHARVPRRADRPGWGGCRHLQRRGRRWEPDLLPHPPRARLPGPHGEHHQHRRDLARLPGLGGRVPQRDRRPGPSAGPAHAGGPGRRRRRRTAPPHDVPGDLRRRGPLARPGGGRPLRRAARAAACPRPGLGPPRTRPVLLVAGVFAASVYGGYFGAAMGVMFLAVLGPGAAASPSPTPAACAPSSP